MANKSAAWKHFKKLSNEKAECHNCKATIKCTGGSTSGLMRHYRSRHGESNLENGQSGAKKQKIWKTLRNIILLKRK